MRNLSSFGRGRHDDGVVVDGLERSGRRSSHIRVLSYVAGNR